MKKRTIGLYEGVALYVAAILGSGVLFLSGIAASIARSCIDFVLVDCYLD